METDYLFSKPRIYDGGGDINKRWYVYFSYRNPETGKMERQAPIYLGINRIKSLRDRKTAIKTLRNVVERMLKEGVVPTEYQNNYSEGKSISIQEVLKLAQSQAKSRMKESSFKDYQYRLKVFEKWLNERNFTGRDISEITKKTVINFLNDILERTSAKNRNNTRANLSIFFSFLEENEYISENFVKKIKIIDSKPQRNKTYTPNQEVLIFDTLKCQDLDMLLFIKFISYNFLRPIEVCRLRVKDIDFLEAQLTIETKTQSLKTKIIPNILMKELSFLKDKNPEHFIFTPNGVGEWGVSETGRRDYWTKRFKKVKDQLRLDKDYTIYSFRHTFITKLYRELRVQYPPYETKSRLMLITGHSSMTALEKYLRNIDV